MRYIKNFNLIDDYTSLKKYVAWKFPSNLMILEVIETDKDFSKFLRLYNYNENSNYIGIADNLVYVFNKHEIKKRVVYTTNNINELLDVDMLESFFSIDKYNL